MKLLHPPAPLETYAFADRVSLATLLVAYVNGTASAAGIRTLLVTVPEAALLAAADRDCDVV